MEVAEHQMTYLKIKDRHVKVFNMMARINEAEKMVRHISFDGKCKFNSTTCNSNQKEINDTCQYKCKNYYKCKKIIVVILVHVFARMEDI